MISIANGTIKPFTERKCLKIKNKLKVKNLFMKRRPPRLFYRKQHLK